MIPKEMAVSTIACISGCNMSIMAEYESDECHRDKQESTYGRLEPASRGCSAEHQSRYCEKAGIHDECRFEIRFHLVEKYSLNLGLLNTVWRT